MKKPLEDRGGRDPEIRYRAILNSTRIIAFTLVSALLIAFAFYMGTKFSSPSSVALQNAQQKVPVTALVENRVINTRMQLDGKIVSGQSIPVFRASGGRDVVSDLAVEPGQTIAPGSYLGAISGNPLFVLPSDIPIYRDLKLDDRGPDVSGLQMALIAMGFPNIAASGVMDLPTLQGIRAIYEGDNIKPPGADASTTTFRMLDFVQIPSGTGLITQTSPVSRDVTTESPMVTVQVQPNVVVVRASVIEADKVPVGTEMLIEAGNVSTLGRVSEIGEYSADTSTVAGPGKDVTLELLETSSQNLQPEQPVVAIETGSPESELAVPLVAVQEDPEGQYVDVVDPAALEKAADTGIDLPFSRIRVVIRAEAAGWVALAPHEALVEGDTVLIP